MSAITSADGFHHLVYSISGTTHTVFLDGSAVSVNTNGTNVFSTFPNISNLLIGTAADLSFGYTGFIDDFKIFNRALGSTEVSTIYSTNAIPPFTPRIIDTLSTAAYNQMVYKGTTLQAGAFGVKLLLYSAKSNPVIQIKAGTGGTPTDFYAPTDGTTNITTGANGAGTGIVSFLNGAVGYVTKWYDQTGNGHHATAAGTTLPTFNTTTKVVDFGTTGYFSLADNSFPTGNSSYTYLYKQGILPNATGNIAYSGGTAGNALMELLIINNNGAGRVSDGWYETDGYNTSNVLQSNSIIAATYGGGGNNNGATGKLIYMNNNNIAFQYYNSGNGNRYQTSANCYLGYTQLGYTTYQSTMSYFYWMPYQLGSADRIILGNT